MTKASVAPGKHRRPPPPHLPRLARVGLVVALLVALLMAGTAVLEPDALTARPSPSDTALQAAKPGRVPQLVPPAVRPAVDTEPIARVPAPPPPRRTGMWVALGALGVAVAATTGGLLAMSHGAPLGTVAVPTFPPSTNVPYTPSPPPVALDAPPSAPPRSAPHVVVVPDPVTTTHSPTPPPTPPPTHSPPPPQPDPRPPDPRPTLPPRTRPTRPVAPPPTTPPTIPPTTPPTIPTTTVPTSPPTTDGTPVPPATATVPAPSTGDHGRRGPRTSPRRTPPPHE